MVSVGRSARPGCRVGGEAWEKAAVPPPGDTDTSDPGDAGGSLAQPPLCVPPLSRSIAMIHRQSRGQLPLFAQGLEAFKNLKVSVGGWADVLAGSSPVRLWRRHRRLLCWHSQKLLTTRAVSLP